MSAVQRLIPRPPARVVNKNINLELFGALNCSIYNTLSSESVCPSIRQYSKESYKTQCLPYSIH